MAGYDEYEWREYQDFSGGLWERGNDRECAPNGLLECTDCFPQPWGGLKAFAAFEPIATGFSSAPVGSTWILGIWSMPQGGIGGFRNWFMLTIDSVATVRLYTLSGTGVSVGESFVPSLRGDPVTTLQWALIASQATVSLDTGIRMESYRSNAGGGSYYSFPASSSGGIWEADGATANLRFASTVAPLQQSVYGLWTHQGRLVTVTDEGTGNQQNTIVYTDAGSTAALSTANTLRPLGESAGVIRGLSPAEPSELLFWKDEIAFGDIQGAIVAPSIRQNGYQHLRVRNFPIKTPIGVVSVVSGEGAYAWSGSGVDHISPSILGDAMGGTAISSEDDTETSATASDLEGATFSLHRGAYACVTGHLGCYEHWVFFNNGYVMDARTGAWFKQTSAPGARYWGSDSRRRLVFVSCRNSFTVQAGQPFPPAAFFSQMGETYWTPMHTYSFTPPLIESPGQKTNLRELEYELYAFNSESTITVEVSSPEGALDTLGPYTLASDASSVRITVPGHPAEWYKVRTTLKSNRPGEEAPLMSKMRVGTQASTRNQVNR